MTWIEIAVRIEVQGEESTVVALCIIYSFQLRTNGCEIGRSSVRGIIIPTKIIARLIIVTITIIVHARQLQIDGTAILIDVIIIFHLYGALHAALVKGRVGNAEIMCKGMGICPRHAQHGKDSECPCRAEKPQKRDSCGSDMMMKYVHIRYCRIICTL